MNENLDKDLVLDDWILDFILHALLCNVFVIRLKSNYDLKKRKQCMLSYLGFSPLPSGFHFFKKKVQFSPWTCAGAIKESHSFQTEAKLK